MRCSVLLSPPDVLPPVDQQRLSNVSSLSLRCVCVCAVVWYGVSEWVPLGVVGALLGHGLEVHLVGHVVQDQDARRLVLVRALELR